MLKVSVEFPFLSQNWLILALLTNLLTGINETGNGTASEREGDGGEEHLKKRTPTPPKICYWVLSGTFNWITCSSFSAVWVPRVVLVVFVVAVATDAAVSWLLCQKIKKREEEGRTKPKTKQNTYKNTSAKLIFCRWDPVGARNLIELATLRLDNSNTNNNSEVGENNKEELAKFWPELPGQHTPKETHRRNRSKQRLTG